MLYTVLSFFLSFPGSFILYSLLALTVPLPTWSKNAPIYGKPSETTPWKIPKLANPTLRCSLTKSHLLKITLCLQICGLVRPYFLGALFLVPGDPDGYLQSDYSPAWMTPKKLEGNAWFYPPNEVKTLVFSRSEWNNRTMFQIFD